MSNLTIAVAIYASYLIGSLSSAIIVCQLMRLPDPRTQGSRNPGATNVLRIGGKKAAIITLLGDMLKGLLPVALAKIVGLHPLAIALIALAAFLGHLFPIFFRFEGGKGVATAIGCLLAISFPAGICWLLTWMCIAFLSRYSSLASLIASLLAPGYIWFFTQDPAYAGVFLVMSLLLIWRHQSNLSKLIAGTESKIGEKK